MGTLQEQLNLARKLNPQRISNRIFDIIRSIEDELLDINTKGQLNQGINASGGKLYNKKTKRSLYSPLTEEISGGKKKAGTPYTFEDTGDFFKGFFIKVYKDKAVFGSNDSKTPLLVSEYDDLFGLTDKNLRSKINSKILPELISKIRTHFGI